MTGKPESGDNPRLHFSLVLGGPFHRLLGHARLAGDDGLPTMRAGLVLAFLAWLPPALLAVTQTLIDPGFDGWGFFADWTVYTRYLVAITVMIATERYADGRIALLIRHFRDAHLVPGTSREGFANALARADRRSASAYAELVILIIALAWPGVVADFAVALAGVSWEGLLVGGEAHLSWAGAYARYVSTPIFVFLVLRWVWRFIVWTALLRAISRLSLRLTPLHPDRAAGLGFLAIFPSIFSGLVFALGCVVASSFLKDLGLEQHSAEVVWFAIAAWVVIVLLVFVGPLSLFTHPLYLAREKALLEYGRITSRHHLAFQRRWLDDDKDAEELLGEPDASSVSDLNASLQAIEGMRLLPVDRAALIQLLLAAGVPMLAVVASHLQALELLKVVVGSLL